MPWFYVDDDMAFNRKIVAAGNAAVGLWSRAGSWSRKEGTNGFVPTAMARSLGSVGQIKALVDNTLWHKVPGGYAFHQWDDRYDPAKEQERREKRAAAGRLGGLKSGKTRQNRASASEANAEASASNTERSFDTNPTSKSVRETAPRTEHFSTRDRDVIYESKPPQPGATLETLEANAEANASRNTPENEALLQQKRTHVLDLEGSTYVDPVPHVSNRARNERGRRPTPAELNATAHSPRAHGIATRYADHCAQLANGQRPPGQVIASIAVAIDGCIDSGYEDHQIENGIAAWHSSDMNSPTQIPSFVHRVVNRPSPTNGNGVSKADFLQQAVLDPLENLIHQQRREIQ
jgi:hypothetical protein